MSIRKLMLFAMTLLSAVVLIACEETPTLTSLVFEGLGDATVEFQADFNVLTGVRAKGNDGNYYDDSITYTSLAVAREEIDAQGNLDTSIPQTIILTYKAQVGSVIKEQFRSITVEGPAPVEGQMIINGDFSAGIAGWNDASVNFIGEGAAMALAVEDGELKVVFTAGWGGAHTPRFGQAGITFEQGKTYEVSFRAKALEPKLVHLQVGELLSGAPWFTDFKALQTEIRTITTEWADYSYKFTMHLATNTNGAVLFEIGTIQGVATSTTLWFDDIDVVESTPDADTTGPILSGVQEEQNILLGSTFNPLAGVTAFDIGDAADVTDDIVVTIFDADDNEVDEVDTSAEGTFRVVYYVEDSHGNETEAESIVNVVGLLFKNQNLLFNGSFTQAIGEGEDATWTMWHQDWGAIPVVVVTQDTEEGSVTLDITGGGDAAWSVQFTQPETTGVELTLGTTYKVSVVVKAEVARLFNIAIGYGNEAFVEFARVDGLAAGTGETVLEFVFTNTIETHDIKFVFELGNRAGFENGEFTIYEAGIYELDIEPAMLNSDFSLSGWRGFNGNGNVAFDIVDGEFKITVNTLTAGPGNAWVLQLIQDEFALGGSTEHGVIVLEPNTTYVLSFDAYASEDALIHPNIIVPFVWTNYIPEGSRDLTITTTKTTYTIEFTTPAELSGTEVLKFELGNAFGATVSTEKWLAFDNIFVTVKDDEEHLASVYNGDFDQVFGFGFHSPSEANTFALVDGGVEFTITELGGEAYEPHFFQEGINLSAGDHTLVLVVDASVARTLRANLVVPDWGYASLLEGGSHDFAVTTEGQVEIRIDFTLETAVSGIKFELDFGPLGGETVSVPGTFTVYQVLLYRIY